MLLTTYILYDILTSRGGQKMRNSDFDDFCDEEKLDFDSLFREIEKGIEALPKERPYFGPLQVREVEEIQIGKSYYLVTPANEAKQFSLRMEKIKINEIRGDQIFFTHEDGGCLGMNWRASLVDYSVFPYKNGGWNDAHYLEQISTLH